MLPAIFSNGKNPLGFLGYAVNMMNIDDQHLHIRTKAGKGLRETLFYRLFDKLQVYETREQMLKAHAYIVHGAVSLDGGLLIEDGSVSLGSLYVYLLFSYQNTILLAVYY